MEEEVAHCAAQHHAWLVTHLAIIVVLVEKILFVEDNPGLLLLDRNLLILLLSFPLDIITLLMILLQLPLIATDAIAAANETLMMIILRASDAITVTN
jgi:hypothetical protein